MKKTFLCACLAFAGTICAQVNNSPKTLNYSSFGVVPKCLSFDGKNRVYIRTADDEITILANDFSFVKTIKITPTISERLEIYETREQIGGGIKYIEDKDEYVSEPYVYSDWKEISRETNREVESFGCRYDGDFNVTLHNLEGDGLAFSQTLFNKDEKYEYLYFKIGELKLLSEYANYFDEYGEPRERHKNYNSNFLGFEIKSETGDILQSVDFPADFSVEFYGELSFLRIWKIEDEYFLICFGKIEENDVMLVYKINNTQTGSKVVEMSVAPLEFKAFPTNAMRGENITIELRGEDLSASEKQIKVVNMSGQTTQEQKLSRGENRTQLSTKSFSPGVNLIQISSGGKPLHTQKVIVK